MNNTATATPIEEESPQSSRLAWLAVGVAALGYFVDVFDMWLFSMLRVPSLSAIGVTSSNLTRDGAFIINCQQCGFLVGGFVWGIMGDKRGRVSVMFGSILLYSIATLLCAFVSNVEQYAFLRALAGLGLAGEIGAGITLVSELLSRTHRGYGTTLVATLGVAGAIGAAYASKTMHWENAYILGGVMGFVLLGLRIAVYESGMYRIMEQAGEIKRGSLKLLFGSWERVRRFGSCILAGVPIYFVFGIFVTFAPEIGAALGIMEPIKVPDVMLYGSIGMTVGDLGSGLLSQWMRSRKRPIGIFMVLATGLSLLLGVGYFRTVSSYAWACGVLGIFVGYWACLITMTAEQFGTNIRATVTTTVPNLIRSTAILLNLIFVSIKADSDASTAALWLVVISFGVGFVGLWGLRETYGKDLNYMER